jgi:hypothetical protein
LVFHCADAVCAGQKMEKEVGVSERSEFRLLLTFLGEARKVSGRRATPGILSQLEEGTVSATKTHKLEN